MVTGQKWVEVGNGYFVKIDEEDWDRVKIYKWSIGSHGDLRASITHKYIRLKNLILRKNTTRGYVIKNIDGNQLNCTKQNIRLMSIKEARIIDEKLFRAGKHKNHIIRNRLKDILI